MTNVIKKFALLGVLFLVGVFLVGVGTLLTPFVKGQDASNIQESSIAEDTMVFTVTQDSTDTQIVKLFAEDAQAAQMQFEVDAQKYLEIALENEEVQAVVAGKEYDVVGFGMVAMADETKCTTDENGEEMCGTFSSDGEPTEGMLGLAVDGKVYTIQIDFKTNEVVAISDQGIQMLDGGVMGFEMDAAIVQKEVSK